ncbi:acyl-CoA thioesterase [Priestia aryabhattai]|uniref:acyl-CoA thioesterase n=1 Tax=Priestia aryabhattai TaxID=412384 RepID=UPI001C8DEBB4|nr:thioesterase family protein [Priestia aryabhattai]MBX9999366.1 acyl-CoA thioesterase [Priestia aryabhattai]
MYETQVKVRFCETDALGHINNTSYFIYLEEARIAFFEEMGASMHTKKWEYILASTKCDFIAQGYFNQVLMIKTFVSNVGNKSFTIGHEITDSKTGSLIAKGEAIIVYFDFDAQKSVSIPADIKQFLMNYKVAV